MGTRSEGLRRDDLPKSTHGGHLRGFDNEVRIQGEEGNEEHCDDANDQAEQEGWSNDRRALALQNKFWWW